jgi:hypothetical protein
MICKPKNPKLLKAIIKIVEQVASKDQYYYNMWLNKDIYN